MSREHDWRRRDVLRGAANGFGAIALQSLLAREAAGAGARLNPLAAKAPHFPPKAKSVIFLFMVGAPSQIDTFDPKPQLKKYEGQQLPESYGKMYEPVHRRANADAFFSMELQAVWPVRAWVSTLFPHLSQCVDDICFVRNFYTDSVVHAPAMYQVQTRPDPDGLSVAWGRG